MTSTQLNQMANQIFAVWAEQNPRCRQGDYLSPQTNCILAFDAYFADVEFKDVQQILPRLKPKDFAALKKYIADGVEHYLLENAKILTFENT